MLKFLAYGSAIYLAGIVANLALGYYMERQCEKGAGWTDFLPRLHR
jgi:hypothetical protein